MNANENENQISNARNIKEVQNNTISRRKNYTIRQTMYDFFFVHQIYLLLFFIRIPYFSSILDFIKKPFFIYPILTIIIMAVGILIICVAAPKQSGGPFLFYSLNIQYNKNPE